MTSRCKYPCPLPGATRGLCARHYGVVKREGLLHLYPSASATPRPWPAGPLFRFAGLDQGQTTALATRVGADEAAVKKACAEGLTDTQADHWAVALGHVPSLVWGPGWDQAALTPLDEAHLAGGWRQAWEWAQRGDVKDQVATGADLSEAA